LGNENMLMAKGHVAHDCQIGNRCVLTNGAQIAGHVEIGDNVNLSSPSGIHQFVRIGRLAFVGGGATVGRDVPPFMMTSGRNAISALNVIGLRRAGVGPEARLEIKRLFAQMYLSGRGLKQVVESIDMAELVSDEARELVSFCLAPSKRGILSRHRRDTDNDLS
jgi:UDP-N-acetylglucosamine acyltransferase